MKNNSLSLSLLKNSKNFFYIEYGRHFTNLFVKNMILSRISSSNKPCDFRSLQSVNILTIIFIVLLVSINPIA